MCTTSTAARAAQEDASVARDYYAILGVRRDASAGRDQAGVPQAGARAAPRRQPGRRGAGALQARSPRPTRCCPTRRSARSSTSAGTRWQPAAAAAPGGDPFGGFGFGDIMDAFFGGGRRRRPARGRAAGCSSGADALIRMQLDARGVRDRRHPRARRRHRRAVYRVQRVGLRARHPAAAPATPVPAPARCRTCSARSSARW